MKVPISMNICQALSDTRLYAYTKRQVILHFVYTRCCETENDVSFRLAESTSVIDVAITNVIPNSSMIIDMTEVNHN